MEDEAKEVAFNIEEQNIQELRDYYDDESEDNTKQ